MDRKKIALAAASALLVCALYAAWLWQPARQVRLHHAHFLRAVERRNWDKVQGFFADNYSDRWGHDKEFVLREAREVFRQFLFLNIQSEPAPPGITARIAEIRAPVKIAGDGSPVAQFVVEKVNTLREPFVFTWIRPGWKPWDWRLTRIDQPELEIEMEHAF
jgi:hypothetical protein